MFANEGQGHIDNILLAEALLRKEVLVNERKGCCHQQDPREDIIPVIFLLLADTLLRDQEFLANKERGYCQ